MKDPISVRLGGYAPRDSSHSRALDRIAAELRARLGDRVVVEIDYNVMDGGRPIQALLTDVENATTTLCYFSSSYLADRVPALGIVDLPYVFGSLQEAHGALDGPLGTALSDHTARNTAFVALGWWDNGFRHLTNRLRDIRTPHDCRGLRVRLQPNWAHEEFFRALGTEPVCTDLRDGIAMLKSGELDAQENPFANIVSYGLDEVHPHVTLTGHVYGARGVFASAQQLARWSEEAREALEDAVSIAVKQQRDDAARTEIELRRRLEIAGTRILELSADERSVFREIAEPVLDRARHLFDDALWRLLPH